MIAIIMGSDSDLPVVKKLTAVLKDFDAIYEVHIISAHRTPYELERYVTQAEQKGIKVFIGVAGKSAHLPGVIAAYTTCPVIGLPVLTTDLGGMDSLLSIVQMPPGVPVATVGINGAENAGLLALQILALSSAFHAKKLKEHRQNMKKKIEMKNASLKELLD